MEGYERYSVRSPLFYVGDKYKLMPQLNTLFPREIKTYYDVFCGGGSASINVEAESYVMNDIDNKVIELHMFLQHHAKNIDLFIDNMYQLINYYGLSLSEKNKNQEIEEMKKIYKKTYFSKFNKEAYIRLREDYNDNQSRIDLLYLLLVYGFNHMIRFNQKGNFNLPVGNVDWNKNVSNALLNYSKWSCENKIEISSGLDFETFVRSASIATKDFLYFDPPYLITFSEYNKNWGEKEELRLYDLLDELNLSGINWGLSNMISHKGKTNNMLIEWSKKYNIYDIQSNYISRFDNSIKGDSKEVYITNIHTNI